MSAGLPGLFITGTDTGVGKTTIAAAIVSALLSQGRRVAVMKPVATGAIRDGDGWKVEDSDVLRRAIGSEIPLERVSPIVFEEPLAPPVAARVSGSLLSQREVDLAVRETLSWWADRSELAVVEGVGGFLCPLAEGTTVADLAVRLDLPLIIVARRALGTLNHTLLTLEAAGRRGLRIAGIILNSPDPRPDGLAELTNAEELSRRLEGVPILAEVAFHHPGATSTLGLESIAWAELALKPRLD